MGLWFALEDVTKENGCLWFIPGSHRDGVSRLFIRNPDKSSPNLTIYTKPNPEYDEDKFIPGPVPKGRHEINSSLRFMKMFNDHKLLRLRHRFLGVDTRRSSSQE